MARKSVRKSSYIESSKGYISSYASWLVKLPSRIVQTVKKSGIPTRSKIVYKKTLIRAERKPFTSFFTLLGILLFLIIIGSILRRPVPEKTPTRAVKDVSIYKIGGTPEVSVQAVVEKTGVIKIVALTPGIVKAINVTEGQEVSEGATLMDLSSNYSGGNAATVQRQIAGTQYQNIKDTYDTQKDLISKQKEQVEKNKDNTENLRKIAEQASNQSTSLINLNGEIISNLNNTLSTLTPNTPAYLAQQQMISGIQGGQNQLENAQRTTQYQVNPSNPPTQLANISADIALKQLDIQAKALAMNLQISGLQLQLAQIAEQSMFPSAPFAGTVERINVQVGQSVNPGTVLASLHGDQTAKIVAKVPSDVAAKVSKLTPSTLHIGKSSVKQTPLYVSTDATDGQLYTVIFNVPTGYEASLTNSGYIQVDLTIGYDTGLTSTPFVPIDAVYQGQNSAYIFINNHGIAKSKSVTLGNVFGKFVQVEKGLSGGDEVIVSRSVLEGDKIAKQ